MDLDGAAKQVAELLAVAVQPGGAAAVGHRDHHRVELRDHPPLGVQRRELGLRVLVGQRPLRHHLTDRRGGRGEQLADRPLGQGRVLTLLRRLLASHGRERVRVRLGPGVGVARSHLAQLGQLRRQLLMEPLGACQDVLERKMAQLRGRVLQREEVLDLVVEALAHHPSTVLVGRVQQRRDEPVALVEVGLPVQRVVLVRPRDVPDRRTRQAHCGEAGRRGAYAELRVVPLDEQRQAQPDGAQHLGRDQAHEPAVEVHVDPAVKPARGPQVALGEVPVGLDRLRRLPPEAVPVDDLAEAVQPGLRVETEHVTTDDRRPPAQVAEGHRADDALRLADDVVVHAHHVGRTAGLERLELGSGVAAGPAHVGLHDHPELVTQRRLAPRRSPGRR